MFHAPIWRLLILLFAIAPLAYYVVAIMAANRFFRRKLPPVPSRPEPPVSLLKPVHGVDFASYENFASFCQQNYGAYEVLFCVNDLDDSAVPVIERLKKEYPQIPIRLFSGAPQIGTNRKVNNLALLTKESRYETLVQTDGDVRVGRDFLKNLIAPLANPNVGVVSCLYRGIAEPNLGAELEAIGAASDFLAGAMVADWKEGVSFALGAAVATTKTWLKKIGGYEGIADYLADDYEIGNRACRAGAVVLLSHEPVWTMYPAQTFSSLWQHQVRWARTLRLVRPWSYVGLIVTQGLPWAVAAALCGPTFTVAAVYLAAYVVLRLTMAWMVGVKSLGDDVLKRRLWLVPLRDAIHFFVWIAGFTSNRVTWNGANYTVRDGKMAPIS